MIGFFDKVVPIGWKSSGPIITQQIRVTTLSPIIGPGRDQLGIQIQETSV